MREAKNNPTKKKVKNSVLAKSKIKLIRKLINHIKILTFKRTNYSSLIYFLDLFCHSVIMHIIKSFCSVTSKNPLNLFAAVHAFVYKKN
jgi:hypothetical protein